MKRTDTKQAIINAAFSFYETPHFARFSLGEVAKKVGISKAAVFRHFKNKDELISEMRRNIFNAIGEVNIYLLNGLEIGTVLNFAIKNPQYTNYLLEEFLATPDFEKDFYKLINIDEKKVLDENGKIRDEKKRLYMRGVYALTAFFFFVQSQSEKNAKKRKVASEEITKQFWSFIQNGVGNFLKDKNAKIDIDEKRLDELDELCKLSEDEFPVENKFMVALSNILEKEHIGDVTVEKIASELGIAKSSLYSHFPSKQEFFLNLVKTEKDIFYRSLERNYKFIKEDPEFLYIQLVTTINFLKMRKSTLSVFGWLRSENDYIEDDELDEIKKIVGETDTEVSELVELFAQFVCCIAITTLIKARYHEFSDLDLKNTIRLVFSYFMHGVDDIKVENNKVKFVNKRRLYAE